MLFEARNAKRRVLLLPYIVDSPIIKWKLNKPYRIIFPGEISFHFLAHSVKTSNAKNCNDILQYHSMQE